MVVGGDQRTQPDRTLILSNIGAAGDHQLHSGGHAKGDVHRQTRHLLLARPVILKVQVHREPGHRSQIDLRFLDRPNLSGADAADIDSQRLLHVTGCLPGRLLLRTVVVEVLMKKIALVKDRERRSGRGHPSSQNREQRGELDHPRAGT